MAVVGGNLHPLLAFPNITWRGVGTHIGGGGPLAGPEGVVAQLEEALLPDLDERAVGRRVGRQVDQRRAWRRAGSCQELRAERKRTQEQTLPWCESAMTSSVSVRLLWCPFRRRQQQQQPSPQPRARLTVERHVVARAHLDGVAGLLVAHDVAPQVDARQVLHRRVRIPVGRRAVVRRRPDPGERSLVDAVDKDPLGTS